MSLPDCYWCGQKLEWDGPAIRCPCGQSFHIEPERGTISYGPGTTIFVDSRFWDEKTLADWIRLKTFLIDIAITLGALSYNEAEVVLDSLNAVADDIRAKIKSRSLRSRLKRFLIQFFMPWRAL